LLFRFVVIVDVIGVLTGISVEREYVREGKMTKMVIIELTDHTGKCECALFGEYVDELNKKMGKNHDSQPLVVIQFAKVKIFRGMLLLICQLIWNFAELLNVIFFEKSNLYVSMCR
jgi:DNA polymerase III alpha subunit